jgi:LmbE family N-acetylglucosaminyl deacetylase
MSRKTGNEISGPWLWWIITLTGIAIILGGLFVQQQEAVGPPPKQISEVPQDRILVLSPHPDDDILGCAGIIQKAKKQGLPVKVVYLTYGDMNEWSFLLYRKRPVLMPQAAQMMGQVRHDEAIDAESVLGVPPEDLIFLGYPDFGTMNIWYRHWDEAPAYHSLLTKVSAVPYANAFRPGAPYKGEEIVEDLKTIIRDFKPTKIFVSHPGDHNVDHRAFYLFMRIALWDLKDEVNPEIYPYIIHFKFWPKSGRAHLRKPLMPPAILKDQITWSSVDLSDDELMIKEKAIRVHRSQFMSSGLYLNSFVRPNELFGDFPTVKVGAGDNTTIPSESKEDLLRDSQLLSDNQKVSFVGVQDRTVSVHNGAIEVNLHLSRPLGRAVGASIYLYGYRHDRDFKTMPKLHIKIGAVLYDVFDQRQKISERAITVRRGFKSIDIIVPLKLLGDPDDILTSAQTYLGKVPLDWLSWRTIELKD